MHDGGIEAGLDALVEEDGVEHLARRRGEAEGDVRQPEDGVGPGSSDLIRRIASIVSMPSRRDSSMPVESGRASGSKRRSYGSKP